jgi:4-amino-4-deoxy-L-arabinose transferase-like glycosyltransferase
MTRLRRHHVALALTLAFSALLECYRLSQNVWANDYYSAAVRSMVHSLHNFFFVSADPGGLITVDKPPLGLWLQTVSAAIFGFHPLSLLLPEALCAVAAVATMYLIVTPSFGAWAGVGAAAALAVFPSFVASGRDNNLDALLLMLMALACACGLRAIEGGRWRWLLATAVLVGLAFNTKTLAAYLVLPGLGLGWIVCAPGSLRRRTAMLAAATALLAVVSMVWLLAVTLTPASQRPYVGGTTDDSELSLSFSHNGLGRVLGERGAPGHIVHVHHATRAPAPTAHASAVLAPLHGSHPHRLAGALSTVGSPGPLRLFDDAVGDQGGWLLPFALVGLIAVALLVRGSERRDPRLALALVGGGWLVCEVVVLSLATGIVAPYYVSALGPGVALMCGAGSAAFAALVRRRRVYAGLPAAALALTLVVAVVLLHREFDYLHRTWPLVAVVMALALGLSVLRPQRAGLALGVALLAGLVIPAIYSATVWQVPVDGTFPAAGPYIQDNLDNHYGIPPDDVGSFRTLLAYVIPREPGARWDVLTEGANTAAVFTLLGGSAGAMGGYGTTDPALSAAGLAGLIERGETRFVALGGGYASRGGNAASAAVEDACRRLPPSRWRAEHNFGTAAHPRYAYPQGGWNLVLYDCAGRAPRLAAA